MKKITFLFSLVTFLDFSSIQAQTADEVVANYLEVIGGVDKITAIKSMKTTGTAKAQGMDIPITMYQVAPNMMRMNMNMQGQEITQASFNGKTGWSTNFMTMEPEAWDAEQSKITETSSDFPDPFANYKGKGYQISFEGEQEIDGTPSYKLKLTKPELEIGGEKMENYSFHYFDQETGIQLKQTDFGKVGPQKGIEIDTYYSDYEEIEGVYYPFSITQKVNDQVAFAFVVEKIEINADLDKTMFDMPAKKLEPAIKGEDK